MRRKDVKEGRRKRIVGDLPTEITYLAQVILKSDGGTMLLVIVGDRELRELQHFDSQP